MRKRERRAIIRGEIVRETVCENLGRLSWGLSDRSVGGSDSGERLSLTLALPKPSEQTVLGSHHSAALSSFIETGQGAKIRLAGMAEMISGSFGVSERAEKTSTQLIEAGRESRSW